MRLKLCFPINLGILDYFKASTQFAWDWSWLILSIDKINLLHIRGIYRHDDKQSWNKDDDDLELLGNGGEQSFSMHFDSSAM